MRTFLKIVFLPLLALAVFSTGTASAAALKSPREKLDNKINAEEARMAELKVQLYPLEGINHTLGRFSRGNDVKLLQKFLSVYGAYPEGLITGYFGPLTEAAVKRFQKKESLEAVGAAGPKTRSRMVEISQKKAAEQDIKNASTTAEIKEAALADAITESGKAAKTLTSFASTTRSIYVVLALQNARQDTELGYIRYYNVTYVDSASAHPSRTGLAYFHFEWSLKSGEIRPAGNYSLQFYVDGKKSKTISYAVY